MDYSGFKLAKPTLQNDTVTTAMSPGWPGKGGGNACIQLNTGKKQADHFILVDCLIQ